MDNILNTHILKTSKRLKKYCSIILKSKYDKSIFEKLLETYINARYYNFDIDQSSNVFYRKIFDALKKKSEKLISEDIEQKEDIENCLYVFQYLFYFDFVRNNISLEEVIRTIAEKRATKFNLKVEDDGFEEKFWKLVTQDMDEVYDYIDSFDTSEFLIEFSRINQKNANMYRVLFNYNFDFPEIFNIDVVNETFNTDIIAEDKLYVEYELICARILSEVIVGNFKNNYVLDFAPSLFRKNQKLNQLLNLVDNIAVQEKIMFEIGYEDFINNKNNVFRLMKKGFRFALKTTEKMPELSSADLQMLNVFSLVIVDSDDVNKKKYNTVLTL